MEDTEEDMKIDLREIESLAQRKLVIIKSDPISDLVIANYTDDVTYGRLWDEHTLLQQCRGLVFHRGTGEVYGRPWRKWFNMGERPSTSLSDILQHSLEHGEPEKSIKLDGSMIQVFFNPDHHEWRVTSRGSFTSEQALWATSFFKRNMLEKNLHPAYTYLFEGIYPADRKVVDYKGKEDLILIGIVETQTGYELSYKEIINFAQFTGLSSTSLEQDISLEDISILVRRNFEGYVLHWPLPYPENGLRLKVKTEDYQQLHRAIMGLSERAVWEILSSGRTTAELLAKAPDELEDWLGKTEKGLQEKYKQVLLDAHTFFMKCDALGIDISDRENMKRLALQAKDVTRENPSFFPLLINLIKGKPIDTMAWERIKPVGSPILDGVGQIQKDLERKEE